MERQIREDKRLINALESELRSDNKQLDIEQVRQDLNTSKTKYTIHNNILTDFLNQTKLRKDYTRLRI